ncbi:MAG: cobalamin biosynthesis protein CobD, partial [Nitrospinae bacterium]|nr:cobalamin biosynthesis protein CobD [Nitrospinota bacterium]
MSFYWQVVLAYVLDLMIGDPRGYPHPVRVIGYCAQTLERINRALFKNQVLAGLVTALAVAGGTYAVSWGLLKLLSLAHPWAEPLGSVFLIYTALATRSLYDESRPVLEFLQAGNEDLARKSLSNIVGRDTGSLDRKEIARAAVETVAESSLDGIVAPLFYACLGGAPLAMAYKAVNTMDSMFGHKDETYRDFGRVPARLDDAANFIPARLTGLIMALGSALCGFSGKEALSTALRDGQNHDSPNAGIPEAAMAGALGIQLGGRNYYAGLAVEKPFMGKRTREIAVEDIANGHKIMFATSGLALMVFVS